MTTHTSDSPSATGCDDSASGSICQASEPVEMPNVLVCPDSPRMPNAMTATSASTANVMGVFQLGRRARSSATAAGGGA
jgi:hypothetical protein